MAAQNTCRGGRSNGSAGAVFVDEIACLACWTLNGSTARLGLDQIALVGLRLHLTWLTPPSLTARNAFRAVSGFTFDHTGSGSGACVPPGEGIAGGASHSGRRASWRSWGTSSGEGFSSPTPPASRLPTTPRSSSRTTPVSAIRSPARRGCGYPCHRRSQCRRLHHRFQA